MDWLVGWFLFLGKPTSKPTKAHTTAPLVVGAGHAAHLVEDLVQQLFWLVVVLGAIWRGAEVADVGIYTYTYTLYIRIYIPNNIYI